MKLKHNSKFWIIFFVFIFIWYVVVLTYVTSDVYAQPNSFQSVKAKLQVNIILVGFEGGPILSTDFHLVYQLVESAINHLKDNHFPYLVDFVYDASVDGYPIQHNLGSFTLIDYYNHNRSSLHNDLKDIASNYDANFSIIINNFCDQAQLGCSLGLLSHYMENIAVISYQDPFGVVAHEIAHHFGAIDVYYEGGLGFHSLMGSGAWNGPNFDGSIPAPIDMYNLIRMGWMPDTATHIDSSVHRISTKYLSYTLETDFQVDIILEFVTDIVFANNNFLTDYWLIYYAGSQPKLIGSLHNPGDYVKSIQIEFELMEYYEVVISYPPGPILKWLDENTLTAIMGAINGVLLLTVIKRKLSKLSKRNR